MLIVYTDVPGDKLLMREVTTGRDGVSSGFLAISAFTRDTLDAWIKSGAVVSSSDYETALKRADEFRAKGIKTLPVNVTIVNALLRS